MPSSPSPRSPFSSLTNPPVPLRSRPLSNAAARLVALFQELEDTAPTRADGLLRLAVIAVDDSRKGAD